MANAVVIARSHNMPAVTQSVEKQRMDLHELILSLQENDESDEMPVPEAGPVADIEGDVHQDS